MSKEIYISSTPHETRLAIVEDEGLAEIYYERENEYTLAGSIYNGKVTRVLPGMQSSFVDIGLERDAFLYITDFMEEAGDSADFDTNGDSHRQRGEGRRTEGDDAERRGRGRRDRGGRSRDRQGYEAAPPAAEDTEAPHVEAVDEGHAEPERSEAEPVGEGAPGADGGRRWRGRRGRRRGRGPAQREAAPQHGAADESEDGYAVEEAGDAHEVHEVHETHGTHEDTFDLEAATVAPVEESAGYPQENSGGRERDDRNSRRGRGDRGSRDRGRNHDRDQRQPRVPRGFEPRASYYSVENSGHEEAAFDGPVPEPILLPGESLSKYRKPGDEPAAAAPKTAEPSIILPATPSFAIPAGWDGGAVLPGETLSRHRRSESRQEQRAAQPKPMPAAALPETEYEPTEASASYRVDPVAPSEFRQSAPVVEAPEAVEAAEESWQPRTTEFEKFDWQTGPASSAVTEEAAPQHELTAIHATGEMMTEPPAAAFVAEETAAAAEPIRHETAVAQPAEMVEEHPRFAPGHGELAEEAADEEDFATTLHASSIEEMDDLDEEETLEGAADLGTMLREMSIDEITRTNGEDEEDDLEEEDAAHDFTFEGEDESDAVAAEETEEDGLEDEFAADGEAAHADGHESSHDGDTAPRHSRDSERRDGRPGRRDGRRDGRRGDRGRHDRHDRPRHSGDRRDHRGRASVQATDLPAISELLKPGQEVLVQIAKEPIAKKGARITSHIALPGRFLVFMPTVNHTGVSRKIDSDGERRRLKEILLSEKGDASGGFIVRTAAEGASEEELRSDLRFLLNLWADIKQRSESSKSPALIYHDLNLVERILRDQVTDNFSAIWVDSEADYERILRFLQRFQPSLIRRVKLYTKETPLFEQFGITEEINKALRSKVWLKSGGSIVINQTEALVAIDINTGKYVGKTARLEDTIVKTNLDAIPEIVRQIRLRDLGGIIIIDFIDMDERKNRNRVMAALEEELKNDRAPSKVLQFNDFGLVAITRKRVKQSLERTLSTTCGVCQGTGMTKSPITVCNDIYIEMRKMQRHLDRGDVMLRVNPEVVKQLKAPGTKWLQEMEDMVGKTILVKSDPSLHPEQFDIH
ncbi:Rne/Rng family ribonuclease [Edaphobacter sp.]|uniref:Rne/Rng family ribonuclease n=1 Tax=Edaphobacter sp. TaxID=1934404 RepID=UPI002DB5C064|nr:Rne/Rng family ribonuclease [Edaphobacter sp.]HEU5341577.1 Rne/Rng family ribonuclease [Edaphobacter sp.]